MFDYDGKSCIATYTEKMITKIVSSKDEETLKAIERYCDETEFFLLPMALGIDFNMYQELINLIMTRRRYLEDGGYFCPAKKHSSSDKIEKKE